MASDLSTFASQVSTAFGDISRAAGPTLQLPGGAGLTALRAVASIMSGVVGPAVVTVSHFMDEHKTVVRDLITVALVPLAIRLAALSVIKPVGAIAGLAKDIVSFPFSQARQIWTDIQSGYQTVSTAAGTVKDGLTTAASKGLSAWQTVSSGASSTWDFVTSKASAGKDSLISSFNSARFRAAYLWQGVKDGGSTALTTLKSVGSSALTMGSNLGQAAKAGAASAWSGMVSGLQSVAAAGKAAGAALLEAAVAAGQSALAATRAAIAWVAEKVATLASAVAEGVLTAAEWLLNFALNASPIGLVIIAIVALVAAVIYAWNHFTWFRVGVEVAFRAIEAAALWLWHNVFEPAAHGIVAAFDAVGSFFSDLPGMITGFFSDAEHWLEDAGARIIRGLVHGIESSISSVKNTLTNLTSDLTSWKGPPEKDAVLLQPAGQLLISGLINGIENKIPSLRRQLTGLTTEIGSMQPALGPSVANAGALAVTGSARLGALAVGQSAAATSSAGLPDIVVQVDGRTLFKIVQTEALRNGKRNPTSGLVYT